MNRWVASHPEYREILARVGRGHDQLVGYSVKRRGISAERDSHRGKKSRPAVAVRALKKTGDRLALNHREPPRDENVVQSISSTADPDFPWHPGISLISTMHSIRTITTGDKLAPSQWGLPQRKFSGSGGASGFCVLAELFGEWEEIRGPNRIRLIPKYGLSPMDLNSLFQTVMRALCVSSRSVALGSPSLVGCGFHVYRTLPLVLYSPGQPLTDKWGRNKSPRPSPPQC